MRARAYIEELAANGRRHCSSVEENLAGKRTDPDFGEDVGPLLRPGFAWDFEAAMDAVLQRLVALRAGDSWKGAEDAAPNLTRLSPLRPPAALPLRNHSEKASHEVPVREQDDLTGPGNHRDRGAAAVRAALSRSSNERRYFFAESSPSTTFLMASGVGLSLY